MSSFYLYPITPTECNNLIKSMKITKQAIDNIPVHLFIGCGNIFSPILCDIINLSFSTGIFPKCLKKALVTPIHKGGETWDIRNYRPISVLPLLSKLFEKCIHKRLCSFLDKFSILNAPCIFRSYVKVLHIVYRVYQTSEQL